MKSILAVDDSRAVRGLLAFTLKQAGYEVHEASGGDEALAVLAAEKIDCVLTDMAMPGMDGLSLIREMRGHPSMRGLPIVMLAAEKDESLRQEGRQAGATGWLKKPFNTDKLLGTLGRILA